MAFEEVRRCDACGAHYRCRQYMRKWWLCLNGPSRCYRRRKQFMKMRERTAAIEKEAEE